LVLSEQIEGKTLTAATDLFSAGSVLSYAATGKSPWGNEDTMTKAAVYGILASEPNLHGMAPEQRDLVKVLLDKEPSARSLALDDRNQASLATAVTIPERFRRASGQKQASQESFSLSKRSTGSRRKALFASLASLGLAGISALVLIVLPSPTATNSQLSVEMSFLENYRGGPQVLVRIESLGDPIGISEVAVQPLNPLSADCAAQGLFDMGTHLGTRTFQGDVCVPDKEYGLEFMVSIRTNQGEPVTYLCQADNPSLSRRCSIT
jgi:serine/threonine protein kinase